jgi:hypothetical protein
MQIKERIENCLSDLEQKRQSVDLFQLKVRRLLESLRSGGMPPGGLDEILQTLQSVLTDYAEISTSCHDMVQCLREIGDHLLRIEEGRQKILNGVETILKNLSHLDRLATNGMQVGTGTTQGPTPKKILLVRIAPDAAKPKKAPEQADEDDTDTSAGETVH